MSVKRNSSFSNSVCNFLNMFIKLIIMTLLSMLDRLGADPGFMPTIFFSDEATFHVSGKVNRRNVRIWESQNPHSTQEHVRDNPKLNVWCSLSQNKVIGPFSSPKKLSEVPHIVRCWSSSSFHKLNNCSLTSVSKKIALLHTCSTLSLAIGRVGEDRSHAPPPDLRI